MVKEIPNYLTTLRLLLIPLFVSLLVEPNTAMRWASACIFTAACITDWLDGFIARRFGASSDFGALFDPLADKLLVMSALVMLVGLRDSNYGDSYVPAWLVVVVLSRELWVTGLRAWALRSGRVLPAQFAGKLKTTLQMAAIILLILHDPLFSLGGTRFTAQYIGVNLLLLSVAFSLLSAYDYTVVALYGEGSTPARTAVEKLLKRS